MLLEVLVPRVAAVSLELPWSSEEEELICGESSSLSSGLACQPQSSLGTRSTPWTAIACVRPVCLWASRVAWRPGAVRLRAGGVLGACRSATVLQARAKDDFQSPLKQPLLLRVTVAAGDFALQAASSDPKELN